MLPSQHLDTTLNLVTKAKQSKEKAEIEHQKIHQSYAMISAAINSKLQIIQFKEFHCQVGVAITNSTLSSLEILDCLISFFSSWLQYPLHKHEILQLYLWSMCFSAANIMPIFENDLKAQTLCTKKKMALNNRLQLKSHKKTLGLDRMTNR